MQAPHCLNSAKMSSGHVCRCADHHCCYPLLLLVSQGTGGECGLRGGYVEFTNIHPKTMEELYKIVSINLSPNGVGQVRVCLGVCLCGCVFVHAVVCGAAQLLWDSSLVSVSA